MKNRVDLVAGAMLSVLMLASPGHTDEGAANKRWQRASHDVESATSLIEQGASIESNRSDVRVETRPYKGPVGGTRSGLRRARVNSVLPNESLSQSIDVTLVPVRGAVTAPEPQPELEPVPGLLYASERPKVESVRSARQARILDLIPLPRWKGGTDSSVVVAEHVASESKQPVFTSNEQQIPETNDDAEDVPVVVQKVTLPSVEPLKTYPLPEAPPSSPVPPARSRAEIHVVHAAGSTDVNEGEPSPIQRVNVLEIDVADNADRSTEPAARDIPAAAESGLIELDPPSKGVVPSTTEPSIATDPAPVSAPAPAVVEAGGEEVVTPAPSQEMGVVESADIPPATTVCTTGTCSMPGSKFCGPPLPPAPRCVIDPTVPQMRTQHIIQLGDELEIVFPYQPLVGELTQRRLQEPPFRSERVLVREDGMITLPLIEPVMAAGLTPEDLRALLISRYRALAYNPVANQTNAQSRVYRVCVNDELEIRVRNQPELDDRVVVGPDGRISLLRIGSVVVEGKSIEEIQAELTNLYSKVQAQPEVSVSLREFNSDLVFVDGEPVRIGLKNVDSISVIVRSAVRKVFVMGEVRTPGQLGYQGTMTLSQALASAGGPLRTARLKHIKILRRTNPYCEPEAITVDIRGLMNCKASTDVPLNHMDVVVVGKTPIRQLTDVLEQYIYEVAPMTKNMPNINLFYSLGGGNNGGAIINTNP